MNDSTLPMIAAGLADYLHSANVAYTTHRGPGNSKGGESGADTPSPFELNVATQVLGAGDDYVLLISPEGVVHPERWWQTLGWRRPVRSASESEVRLLLPNCDPQAIPPFGPAYGLPTYAMRTLSDADWLNCPTGVPGTWIRLDREAFEKLIAPTWIDL